MARSLLSSLRRTAVGAARGAAEVFGALTSPIADLESTETMRKTSWRALLEGAPPRSA